LEKGIGKKKEKSYTIRVHAFMDSKKSYVKIFKYFKEESNDNQRGYGEKTHGKKV